MNNMTIKIYTAPELTIVTVAVERGFANSLNGVGAPIDGYSIVDDGTHNCENNSNNSFWN